MLSKQVAKVWLLSIASTQVTSPNPFFFPQQTQKKQAGVTPQTLLSPCLLQQVLQERDSSPVAQATCVLPLPCPGTTQSISCYFVFFSLLIWVPVFHPDVSFHEICRA